MSQQLPVDVSVDLLEKLLIWALEDQDINVRHSSLRLASSICRGKTKGV
jgi:hypothetical protein